jgi:cytochrome c biogenesis protein CcmG, thiol:disulfide interchange protein DsbE
MITNYLSSSGLFGRSSVFWISLSRDCVETTVCHCETPLRRCGNLIYSRASEIASLIIFARKDIVTQSVSRGMTLCINKAIRQRNRVVMGLLIILFFLIAPAMVSAGLRIGDVVPSITLNRLNGVALNIPDSLHGKVLILHFWQAGCSSCRLDMPAMDQLYIKYRNKGLEIIAVNVGQAKESVKFFAAELKVAYPIVLDADSRSAALYGVTDVPRTYIIDRDGVIRYRILGGTAPETLKKLIISLL